MLGDVGREGQGGAGGWRSESEQQQGFIRGGWKETEGRKDQKTRACACLKGSRESRRGAQAAGRVSSDAPSLIEQ